MADCSRRPPPQRALGCLSAGGPRPFTIPQIRTIEILLRKCLPDLSHTDISVNAPHRYVVEMPPTLSREEWLKKYSSSSREETPLPALSEIRKTTH